MHYLKDVKSTGQCQLAQCSLPISKFFLHLLNSAFFNSLLLLQWYIHYIMFFNICQGFKQLLWNFYFLCPLWVCCILFDKFFFLNYTIHYNIKCFTCQEIKKTFSEILFLISLWILIKLINHSVNKIYSLFHIPEKVIHSIMMLWINYIKNFCSHFSINETTLFNNSTNTIISQ